MIKGYLLPVFLGVISLVLVACNQADGSPYIVYITATPLVQSSIPTQAQRPTIELSSVPEVRDTQPTLDSPRFQEPMEIPQQHIVQSGDTLIGIAAVYGFTLDSLLEINELPNPDVLSVGQVIELPDLPQQQTPTFKIIPDSRLVRGPGSGAFNIEAFIAQQPGYVRDATDEVETNGADGSQTQQALTAAQIVERVSLEYSVDPRLLLGLLEYRAGWLSTPDIAAQMATHPMIAPEDSVGVDRSGLYRQLAWTANILNFGYYGWKTRGWLNLELQDGQRFLLPEGLNAGTVALQYLFSRNASVASWSHDISLDGFFRTYFAYFGDPFANAVEPLVPSDIEQPAFTLPFEPGETWYFTGSAHGGWGSGSAWSAIDFAPPDDVRDVPCYVSDYWVTAVADGIIARSEGGAVMLDLDGDGDESTGWTILYLHLAETGRIEAGSRVSTGDRIGRPSCEGGFSNATHVHIARRYNGEWIPAFCHACGINNMRPPFVLGGWAIVGIENQEYQGYLENNASSERVTAEQGRLTTINRISW